MPEFPEAYMGLGHIAMVRGDYAAASGSYTRARDAYATISQELLDYRLQKKGQSQLEIRSRRDDIENLTKILKGGLELESRVRDIEREIDYFDRMEPPRADKRTEAPATVYFFLGNAEFHLDKLEEAVADWEEAARRAPDFGPVFNNLALAYWKIGNKEQGARVRRPGGDPGSDRAPRLQDRWSRRPDAGGADRRRPSHRQNWNRYCST